MKKSTYDNFWNEHFFPIGLKLEKFFLKDNILFDSKLKGTLFESYDEYKEIFKSFSGFEENLENKEKIDRHKIASLVTFCIIINNFFQCNQQVVSHVANSILSVKCGIAILKEFSAKELREKYFKDKEDIKFKIDNFKKNGFLYPPTLKENNEYALTFIRELRRYEIIIKDKKYNLSENNNNTSPYIALLSHIFYFLESYNLSEYGLLQN